MNVKTNILDTLSYVSETLEKDGFIHIADAINKCIEQFINGSKDSCIGLSKISNVLYKKGNSELAEKVSSIIPEILEFDDFKNIRKPKTRKMVPADKVFLMASKLYDKYRVGLIDDDDFEYEKMKELVSMLKSGFSLPPPKGCSLPKDDNWWEYFCKRGK